MKDLSEAFTRIRKLEINFAELVTKIATSTKMLIGFYAIILFFFSVISYFLMDKLDEIDTTAFSLSGIQSDVNLLTYQQEEQGKFNTALLEGEDEEQRKAREDFIILSKRIDTIYRAHELDVGED